MRACYSSGSLPVSAADDGHELLDLTTLINLVARGDREFDAMADVIAKDFLLETPQGRAHRGNLRDNIDAIPVLLDHSRQAAHLTLDPIETFGARRLDVFSHESYIPVRGI